MKKLCTFILIAGFAIILSGCGALNPRSLTVPVATPEAAFKYNLHAKESIVDANGNETVRPVDGDTIVVDQTALKDNWNITLKRSYYDTTAMPREGMKEFAAILRAHVETGNVPTNEQLLLYAGGLQTIANYDIPLILSNEEVDASRMNDPDAFAAARVAQFGAAADLAKYQTDAAKSVINNLTPYGAASGAFDTLADVVSAARSSAPAASSVAPVTSETVSTPAGVPGGDAQ